MAIDPEIFEKSMLFVPDWATVASVGELGPTVNVSEPHGEVALLFWPLLG